MMSCESDAESGESEDEDMDIMGDYLDDNSSEDEEEDDNDWSGQNGNLESAVIEAVNGDLPLAAYLIPILHRDYNLAVKNKVESWQFGNTGSGTSGGGTQNLRERGNSDASRGEKSSYTDSPSGGSGGSGNGTSRKRRRRSNSDGGGREGRGFGDGAGRGRGSGDWGGGGGGGGGGGDGGDDGDEDEDKNIDKGSSPGVAGNEEPQPMLACPFHKRNPEKYGIQQTNSANGKKHKYRACTGPGFKSIQRLKEHLKRVHSPVQCNRCYKIFPGTDRATCLANLSEHQKESDACELGDPSQKEGIDAVQWAALERQNRKKNQEAHKLEKWFEIWDVLFPGATRPETPWHDIKPRITPFSPSKDGDAFSKLFLDILDHKIQHQDIDFSSMETDIVRQRLKSVVQQTFKAYISLHGHLSTETSSSELSNGPGGRNRLSIVGGSSTHLSAPATAASHQMSNTTTGTAPTSIGMGTRNNNPQAQQMNPYAQHGIPTSPFHSHSHSHSHSHYGHHSPATPHQPQFMAHSPHNGPIVSPHAAAAMSAAGYTMTAEDPSIASASAVGVNGGGPAANYFYTSYAMFPPPPHPATGTHAAWGAPGQFVPAHHPAAVQQFGMPHPAQQQIGSVGPHGQVGQVTPDHMDVGVGGYQFEVEAGAFD